MEFGETLGEEPYRTDYIQSKGYSHEKELKWNLGDADSSPIYGDQALAEDPRNAKEGKQTNSAICIKVMGPNEARAPNNFVTR